jgi:hypothetical protein
MSFKQSVFSLVLLLVICNALEIKLHENSRAEKNLQLGYCTVCKNVMSTAVIDALKEDGLYSALDTFEYDCDEYCYGLGVWYYVVCSQTCHGIRNQIESYVNDTLEVESVNDFCIAIHACELPDHDVKLDLAESSPVSGEMGEIFRVFLHFTTKKVVPDWEIRIRVYYEDELMTEEIMPVHKLNPNSYYIENTYDTNYDLIPGYPFQDGQYFVSFKACLGKHCTSQKDSTTLFAARTSFTVGSSFSR